MQVCRDANGEEVKEWQDAQGNSKTLRGALMSRSTKACECCGKQFPVSRTNRSRCWPCANKVNAGESQSDICQRLSENTRSTTEATRLAILASQHRMQEELIDETNEDLIRRANQMTVLRIGLKPRTKRVLEPTSNRWRTQKTWRCGRCGRTLDIAKCLACELEIGRG